jgi:GGDEF domain-containing protein
MSQEEMRKELLTSHLTGLPNKRAYEESSKLPIQAFADIDGLHDLNKLLGHDGADGVIRALAGALADTTNQVYHISGDEFYVQAHTAEEVQAIMGSALKTLSDRVFEYTTPDGQVFTKKGIGFSYGYADNIKSAEDGLYADKEKRKQLGLRAERQQTDQGVVEVAAAGREAEGQVKPVSSNSINVSDIPKSLKITIEQEVGGKTKKKLVNARKAMLAANQNVEKLQSLMRCLG